jgi:ribosomal protein L40E
MSIFKTSKTIPATLTDLTPVAQAVMKHFARQDYEVSDQQPGPKCWEIGIHKGGIFRAVIGMKTALRIRIETIGANTEVGACIGLLDSQGISTAVSMLAFWPVLATQTWGLVRQAKLDEEAIAVAEEALLAASQDQNMTRFCHDCGASVPGSATFCPACGAHQ